MPRSPAPDPTPSAADTASFSDPAWRYGVYLFPVPPLLYLLSTVAIALFVAAVDAQAIGVSLVSFFMAVLAGWTSYLFAVVVAVALVLDARALRDHPQWNPNPWLAGALGLAHFAGAFLVVPYLLSVPGIGYYVYRRRQYVGDDGRDGDDTDRDGIGRAEPDRGETGGIET